MRNPGRLAAVLNGIVLSTLSGCGGISKDDQPAFGDDVSDGNAGGRTSGESGSGGELEKAGGGSGGGEIVAVGGAGAGGTGSAGSGAGGNVSKASMPLCDEQGLLRFVEGLHLPEPVDYLGVYLNQSVGASTVYQSTGAPCSGAGDEAACQAALAAGGPSAGFPYQNPSYLTVPTYVPPYAFMYLAYTRGDSVGFIADSPQLKAFLGEIDTANEAGLVFLSMGVGPACRAISENEDAYYYSTPLVSMPCSFMAPVGYSFSVSHAGEVTSTQTVGIATPCVGRRPVGLSSEPMASLNPLGDYYAGVAHLEGAAVLAFDVMARELRRFGAPHDLQLRARRARADEERHHRLMAAFARREGGVVPCVRAVVQGERSLLAAALDNAVEGCVREAWGALSAHYQAAMAADPEARQLWHAIASDESEHAELSLALHAWFMLQLTLEEQELVETAMQRARLELRVELTSGQAPHEIVAHRAGIPRAAAAAALFNELEQQVLSTLTTRANRRACLAVGSRPTATADSARFAGGEVHV